MDEASLPASREATDSILVDEVVSFYQSRFPGKGTGFYSADDWNRLRQALCVGVGESVLDVGISNGAFLHMLKKARNYSRVSGIDIKNHSMLILPEGVEHRLMSVTDMNFPENAFDTVYCMEVLEHLPPSDLPTALKELRRVCRQRLICSLPYCEPEPLFRSHTQSFNDSKIASLFPTAGFCLVERSGVPWILIVEDSSRTFDRFELRTFEELSIALSQAPVAHASTGGCSQNLESAPANLAVATDLIPQTQIEQGTSEDKITPARPMDRVSDLYYGKIFNEAAQRACQSRIHWIVSQVSGERVLDIGCSQGITSHLLAREGFQVVGVDVDEVAIRDATRDQEHLEAAARSRVTFHQLDVFDDIEEQVGLFDSVILGEILEHFSQPQRLIERSLSFLKPDGTIVVTTPFGYKPSADHKHTFSLTDFILKMAPFFQCKHLTIEDTYIRFTGARSAEGALDTYPSAESLIEIIEKGSIGTQQFLYGVQREYSSNNQTLRKTIEVLRQEKKKLQEQTRSLLGTNAQQQKKLGALQDKVQTLRNSEAILHRVTAEGSSRGQKEVFQQKLRQVQKEKDRLILEGIRSRYLEESLRFQLGDTLVSGASSFGGLLRLPVRLFSLLKRSIGSRHSTDFNRLQYRLAVVLLTEGVAAAEREYFSLLSDNPTQESPLARIMYDCMKRISEEKAVNYGERALELNPADTKLRSALALTYKRFGAFSRAKELDPTITTPFRSSASSTSSRVRTQPKLFESVTVASIFDTFTEQCFAPDVNLVPLKKATWRNQLRECKPDFFMAESAWQGNGGEWKFLFNKFEHHESNPLKELLEHCRAEQIPSVFWNKEDPVNYETFLPVAKLFDFIFTTDAESVERYKKDVGHDNVFVLPFAAQPLLHNPIRSRKGGLETLIQKGCFAGSYRGEKYANRKDDFAVLIRPLLPARLVDIYDRYANHPEREKLGFPDPYRSAVVGSLPYEELVNRYKDYMFFLNTNSVTESSTMLSRRVFEILSSGTPVISTPAKALENFFSGEVLTTSTPDETLQHSKRLLDDGLYREQLALKGLRRVLQEHTYHQRFGAVLERVLPAKTISLQAPLVSLICISRRPENVEHCFKNLSTIAYENLEIIFATNASGFDIADLERRVQALPKGRLLRMEEYRSLGDCLNEARKVAQGTYWAKIDDDDYYGAHYLTDLLLSFTYADCGIVGKNSYYCYLEESDELAVRFPGNEYRHCKTVAGATLLMKVAETKDLLFPAVKRGTDTQFQEECGRRDIRIFSADRFNFAAHRHRNISRHTWSVGRETFLKKCQVVGSGKDLERIFV